MAGDNITCTVLFFAAAAEATGCREMELALPTNATAEDAFDAVAVKHASLAVLKQSCAIAVNQQIVPKTTVLQDGCTLAMLPPVSGG